MSNMQALPLTFPFLGITERPYDQEFLNRIDRHAIEPTILRFSYLWLTQTHLTIEGMFGKRYSTDDYPHVVNYQNQLYVEDGTHRLVKLALSNQAMAPMRLIYWHQYNG